MRSSIRLGRLFGIEVGLHYSWFIIALLITMSLGSQFQASHAEWGSSVIWALSILTALLFFVTLLAHEMSHALVARTRGLTTKAITLGKGSFSDQKAVPSRLVTSIETQTILACSNDLPDWDAYQVTGR